MLKFPGKNAQINWNEDEAILNIPSQNLLEFCSEFRTEVSVFTSMLIMSSKPKKTHLSWMWESRDSVILFKV